MKITFCTMGTKEFNSIMLNLSEREVASGYNEQVELYAEPYIVAFDLDCDIQVKYFASATYINPEEAELIQIKHISNIKVLSEDYETEYGLNKVQDEKLAQEIKDNLTVVY